MERTKDIKVGDSSYRLSKLTPLRGIHLANLLITVSMKMRDNVKSEQREVSEEIKKLTPQEKIAGMIGAFWIAAASELDDATYEKIQRQALEVCLFLNPSTSVPEPVIMGNGQVILPQLIDNPLDLDRLIEASLEFSLSPFFLGDALVLGAARPSTPGSASQTAK